MGIQLWMLSDVRITHWGFSDHIGVSIVQHDNFPEVVAHKKIKKNTLGWTK